MFLIVPWSIGCFENLFPIVLRSLLSGHCCLFHSAWDLFGSWYDEWLSVETWTFFVPNYSMRLWILFKSIILAGFLWHLSNRKGSTILYYCQVGIEVVGFLIVLHWFSRGGVGVSLLLSRCESSSSPQSLHWYPRGGARYQQWEWRSGSQLVFCDTTSAELRGALLQPGQSGNLCSLLKLGGGDRGVGTVFSEMFDRNRSDIV